MGTFWEGVLDSLGLSSEGGVKRVVATAAAVVVPFVNKKFGLGLDATDVASVVGALAVFVWQSGHKQALVEAAKVGSDAADKVQTVQDAAQVLGGEVKDAPK